MCGIAGVLKIHQPGSEPPPHHDAIPEHWLNTLDESIKHRGPDGAGRFRDRTVRDDGTTVDVALVHRRLSIIDQQGGHQPMAHARPPSGTGVPPVAPGVDLRITGETPVPPPISAPPPPPAPSFPTPTLDLTTLDPDHTRYPDLVATCFNGCIYNHRELREELEALGHRFCTDHSDTEVLIHGWREWGMDLQDRIDGMYALLIWDRKTGTLVTARDTAGEKPLYSVATAGASFIASSTAAPIAYVAAARSDRPAAPPTGTVRWIRSGAHRTIPLPAHEHRAGAWLVAPSHEAQRQNTPPRVSSPSDAPTLDASALNRAITSRLEADVPLGVFLSGGLDSALIAAVAHKARPDIKAFTVRMPVAAYDESQDAAATASAIGIDHVILDCETGSKTDPARDLVHLIEQLGLPFGDSSLLPTYWLCKAAREHVKVALAGDGGDELFGGYRRHTINTTLTRWRHLLRRIPAALLDQRRPGSRSTYLARLAVAARFEGYRELLSIFPAPDFRKLVTIDGRPPEVGTFRIIDDPLRDDFDRYLPDDLLRKTDTASMAVPLEVRAPFLARDLVESALRTPLDVLMPNGERKGLLKRVARTFLPDHIINRPKRGFAIPIGEWFRTDDGGMRTLLYDHLDPPAGSDPFPGLAEAGVAINMPFVRRLLREHDAAGTRSVFPWNGRDHSQRLYLLLVLSIWCHWLQRVRHDGAPAAHPTPNPEPNAHQSPL